jgi:hypothetical protein
MDAFWAVLSPKAAALTSNGIGCGRSVWAIAPTFQAATMREDAKVVKSFVPLILSVAPGQTIDWANPQSGVTSKLPYNGALIGQAARNWPDAGIIEPTAEDARRWQRDGVSRVFWADKRWSPLGQAPAIPKPIPAPTYEVVTAATTIEPSVVAAALPDLYQAIAHMTIAQSFPGTDPIESAILEFLKSRPDGATVGRIRADKYALKSIAAEEIETYLSVLIEEGKVSCDGGIYRIA